LELEGEMVRLGWGGSRWKLFLSLMLLWLHGQTGRTEVRGGR